MHLNEWHLNVRAFNIFQSLSVAEKCGPVYNLVNWMTKYFNISPGGIGEM